MYIKNKSGPDSIPCGTLTFSCNISNVMVQIFDKYQKWNCIRWSGNQLSNLAADCWNAIRRNPFRTGNRTYRCVSTELRRFRSKLEIELSVMWERALVKFSYSIMRVGCFWFTWESGASGVMEFQKKLFYLSWELCLIAMKIWNLKFST